MIFMIRRGNASILSNELRTNGQLLLSSSSFIFNEKSLSRKTNQKTHTRRIKTLYMLIVSGILTTG